MKPNSIRTKLLQGCCLILAAVFSVSCASETVTVVSRPGAAPVPAVSDGTDVLLPIDAYALTVPEIAQIGRARDLLIGHCMRRFGFEFDEAVVLAESEPADQVADHGVYGNNRRYGVITMATATQLGYHVRPAGNAGNRNPHGLGEPTAAKQMALSGQAPEGQQLPRRVNGHRIPQGGCLGEASMALTGTRHIGEAELVSQIARDSFQHSLSHPTVTTAFNAWAACMRTKGYDYAEPAQAGEQFASDIGTASSQEIATAQADVACKQQTRLVDAWHGVEAAHQQAWIAQHTEELAAIRADYDAQIRRAADVVDAALR